MKYFLHIVLFMYCSTSIAQEIRVVCSVPDLADIVRQIGGDTVAVESLARSGDNPHFITARPSYIRKLANADALVVIGMDMEVGWIPALQRSARNQQVMEGQAGYIDASKAIAPLDVPKSDVDRSMGDVHPHGNPHYLLSPISGMQVARYLAERLSAISPNHTDQFNQGAEAFIQDLGMRLFGTEAVKAHGLTQLLSWHDQQVHKDKCAQLGGWMKDMAPLAHTAWIDDHSQWPYLAACYHIRIAAHLEPKAGIPPSSSHIKALAELCKQETIHGIISAPWFDPRHAHTLARIAQLPVVPLAHQVGSLPNTDTYQAMCHQHVHALTKAYIAANNP